MPPNIDLFEEPPGGLRTNYLPSKLRYLPSKLELRGFPPVKAPNCYVLKTSLQALQQATAAAAAPLGGPESGHAPEPGCPDPSPLLAELPVFKSQIATPRYSTHL